MRKTVLGLLVAAMGAASFIVPPMLARSSATPSKPLRAIGPLSAQATDPVPERLLVKFKPGTSTGAESSAERSVGAAVIGTIDRVGVRVLHVPQAKVKAALQQLRGNRQVEFVERDQVAGTTVIPNDHYWLSEWSPITTNAMSAWT